MKYKKMIAASVIALQLLTPIKALSEQPSAPTIPVPTLAADEPDPGAAVSPMKKGQTAPFTGTLLSPRAVAAVVAQIETQQQSVVIEVNNAQQKERAKCNF